MRYFIGEGHPDAPPSLPWAVCADAGIVTGTDGNPLVFASREEAAQALIALAEYDEAPAGDNEEVAIAWEACLMYEDVPTGDKRIFHQVGHRELPLTLMSSFETSWGHEGARIAGRIDEIDAKLAATGEIIGRGVFDTGEWGAETARLVDNDTLTGVSVDLGDCEEYEFEVIAIGDDGWPTDWLEHFTGINIMGATVLPFPAFEGAKIWIAGGSASSEAAAASPAVAASSGGSDRARTASARPPAGDEYRPPRSWFDNPELSERVPLTVTEDGRVFGHIYGWGECHVGNRNLCLTAPPSASGYAYFRTGAVLCDDGAQIAVGRIALDTRHADTDGDVSWAQAQDHYAHTGLCAAYVAAGDDDHGIWVAGYVRPGLEPENVAVLRGHPPSGDWREIGGNLELVGILSVNTPGYPMPRAFVAAGGHVTALVAAVGTMPTDGDCGCGGKSGAVSQADFANLAAQVRMLTDLDRGRIAAALRERIAG